MAQEDPAATGKADGREALVRKAARRGRGAGRKAQHRERDGTVVLGKDVWLADGMQPVRIVYKPGAAGLGGAVEKCGNAAILLLPESEGPWNFRFIRRGQCDGSGHFEMGGVRPGSYYALAVARVDDTGLDDLGTLRRLAAMGTKVQLDAERAGYVELKVVEWPE